MTDANAFFLGGAMAILAGCAELFFGGEGSGLMFLAIGAMFVALGASKRQPAVKDDGDAR